MSHFCSLTTTCIVYHANRDMGLKNPGCNGTFPSTDFTLSRAYVAMVSMFTVFLLALCVYCNVQSVY